jgi:uncharacterized Zn finger protein
MARTATMNPGTTDRDQTELGFAPLTDDMIAAQTDSGSFSRGKTYFRGGRIFAAVRRGSTLRARCHGSSGGPYLVEAKLAPADRPKAKKPVSYSCDCPRGGFCKHVVALLLTWIADPSSFVVRPPLGEMLAGKSQKELIALIELMVAENPDLEELLDIPVLITDAPGGQPVEEAAIRRQVAAIFGASSGWHGRSNYEDYYQTAARTAAKLERLVDLAVSSAAAGQWRNTLRIFAVLVEELATKLPSLYDAHGYLYAIMTQADLHLAACLDAQGDAPAEDRLSDAERARLLDALLTIWQLSIDSGGVDLGEEGPRAIARSASQEEQRRIGAWLRKALKPASSTDWNRAWKNRATLNFISLLAGDAGLSDEELLSEYRNADLWDDAADLLLRIGRVDEALAIASRRLTGAATLLPFAEQVLATGDPRRIAQMITLVDDRLWEQEGQNLQDDQTLREWLARRYAEHGPPDKALAMARERFDAAPSKATYDAVRHAALLPGQPSDPWPALRPQLIATLRKRGDWYGLIDIYLAEGEVAEAIKALEKSEKPRRADAYGWGYGWGIAHEEYDARVAAAAEAVFPDESIRLYWKLADKRIAARQRPSYQEAARHLERVRHVLESTGRNEEWPPMIADLRQQYKTFRALREELDALGLC